MPGLVNSCWSCFKAGLLLCVVGSLVAVPYFYHRVDEEIRLRVVAKLVGHYQGLAVNVRSAKLVEGEGLEVRGISILVPGTTGPQAELIYIDELFLVCDTQLHQLVGGVPNVRQIIVRRPRIRLTRQDDDSWSAARLWPPPRLSERPADILVEAGSIEVIDPLRSTPSTFTFRDLALSATHQLADPTTAVPAPPADTMEELAASRQPPGDLIVQFRATLTGDYLRLVNVDGEFEPASGRYAIKGTAEGLDFSPELVSALPKQAGQSLGAIASLRAQADLTFRVQHDAAQQPALRYHVVSQIFRGRLDDARLPFPLTDLRATVTCDQQGFSVHDLTARNGETAFKLACQRQGYAQNSPMTLTAEGHSMVVDGRVFDRLPAPLRGLWDKFRPAGEVDMKANLSFDGRTWRPDLLDVKCLNVSFQYDKFRYTLERGTGWLKLIGDQLSLDVTAFSGGDRVQVKANVQRPGPNFTGRIDLIAPSLRLDDKLFAALPPKESGIVRSLNPRGAVDCSVICYRNDPRDPEVHKIVRGELLRCWLAYDKFPYPIGNIQGTFEARDGIWEFTELSGVNDTGVITCSGSYTPLASGGELLLHFNGTNVPLEEELRDALDPKSQKMWDLLRPRGAVDLQNMTVRYVSGQPRPQVSFWLKPRTGATNTSIEPAVFRYRMENLQGAVRFNDGQVMIEDLRAQHGRTQLTTRGGGCDCAPDGQWRLRLENLTVDRLRLDTDNEFVAALPERPRKVIQQLDPRGPLMLSGRIDFAGHGNVPDQTQVFWDLTCDTLGGSLDAGIPLENMQGGIRLAGSFDGQRLQCNGDLNFDSVSYRNIQFTDVKGPIAIDDSQVLIGERQPGRPPRSLSARLYGGTVSGDCRVGLSGTRGYALRATLNNVDLARYTQESVAGRQDLQGKLQGTVELSGAGRGLHTLRGGGTLQLRDADIYKLPLMVALLKILSVRPPNTTAFTESDIDFTIDGGHIYFKKINFTGDAISLLGEGEMDFENEVQLTFHAAVGRGELPIPILGPLVKGASQQFMKITVTGTVDAPVPKAEAFPGVNQTFKELEAGMQRTEDRNSASRQPAGRQGRR